jgi:hypothetical protein
MKTWRHNKVARYVAYAIALVLMAIETTAEAMKQGGRVVRNEYRATWALYQHEVSKAEAGYRTK